MAFFERIYEYFRSQKPMINFEDSVDQELILMHDIHNTSYIIIKKNLDEILTSKYYSCLDGIDNNNYEDIKFNGIKLKKSVKSLFFKILDEFLKISEEDGKIVS